MADKKYKVRPLDGRWQERVAGIVIRSSMESMDTAKKMGLTWDSDFTAKMFACMFLNELNKNRVIIGIVSEKPEEDDDA